MSNSLFKKKYSNFKNEYFSNKKIYLFKYR